MYYPLWKVLYKYKSVITIKDNPQKNHLSLLLTKLNF